MGRAGGSQGFHFVSTDLIQYLPMPMPRSAISVTTIVVSTFELDPMDSDTDRVIATMVPRAGGRSCEPELSYIIPCRDYVGCITDVGACGSPGSEQGDMRGPR